MGQIFQNFIGGVEAGQQQSEQRRRRNALEQAGQLYGTGDAQGAENALMGAGLIQEAGAYTALNEARRARANRQTAMDAVAALGPDATPEARMHAASGAYLNAGDFEQGGQIFNTYAQMNAQQREQVQQNLQFIGQQLPNLRAAPVEQRTALARSTIEGTPFDTPELRAQLDRLDGGNGITDADLDSFEQTLLTYQERLGLQREDAAIARQESQFNRQLAVSRANRSLGAPQIRQFGNDYERGLNAISESIGPQITNAMPWALQVAGNGQVPQGTNTETALINDTGMLRAVARLQTGVGVLTEGEVRSTLGDNLANRLQQAGATINLDEALRPEVRQALATLVQSGVSRASQQAWQYRDNSIEEYRSVNNNQDPVGWGLPSLPHPQDLGSLRAAEQLAQTNGQALRPNDVRISPSGREYIYMGPGNWLPRGTGNTEGYLAGRDQRLAAGGAPTVSVGATPSGPAGGASAGAPVPAVGAVVNGFRFRGGDPNDRRNWVDIRSEQPGRYEGR